MIKKFINKKLLKKIKHVIFVIFIFCIIIGLGCAGYIFFYEYITSTLGIIAMTTLLTCIGNIVANLIYDFISSKKEEKIYLYKKLYIPILKEYILTHKGSAIPFTDLEEASRKKFIKILIDGYVYVKEDTELKNTIYYCYTTYYSKYENNYDDLYISDDEMNKRYYDVIDIIFNMYSSISTKEMAQISK